MKLYKRVVSSVECRVCSIKKLDKETVDTRRLLIELYYEAIFDLTFLCLLLYLYCDFAVNSSCLGSSKKWTIQKAG